MALGWGVGGALRTGLLTLRIGWCGPLDGLGVGSAEIHSGGHLVGHLMPGSWVSRDPLWRPPGWPPDFASPSRQGEEKKVVGVMPQRQGS